MPIVPANRVRFRRHYPRRYWTVWLFLLRANLLLISFLFLPYLAPPTFAAEPAIIESNTTALESADQDYAVTFYHKKDGGLPDNTVNALLQTRDGYLWVGTGAGLVRFDGLNFTSSGIGDVPITALLEDHQGGLWIGTQGRGAIRLLHHQPIIFSSAQGLADDNVTSLTEDSQGTVWIGTQHGLNCWVKNQLTTFNSAAVHAGDPILALSAGRSGTLWLTTRLGVFSLKNGKVEPFPSDELPQGRNAELIGAYEDHAGNLWAFGATFLLNLTQGRRLNSPAMELASSRVWTLCEQRDGAFWIGSGRGLFRFQNRRFEITGAREGLSQCDVRALYADHWGNLWIGTSGRGLARLRARRLQSIGLNEQLSSRRPTSLVPNPAGGFWLGTSDSGLWHWTPRGMEPFSGGPPLDRLTQIQTLCLDSHGALWAGSYGDGLVELLGNRQRRFTTADGLSDNVILALSRDPGSDCVWAGTLGGSLHRVHPTGEIETFAGPDGLTGRPIHCLLPLSGGGLLIGSDSGLVRWDGRRFNRVPAPSELTRYAVRSLYQDVRGRIWVGTWGGGAFCQHGENWFDFSTAQGLTSQFIGQIAQDDEGSFWFGTDRNLVKVSAADVEALLSRQRDTVNCLPGLSEEGLDDRHCPFGWPTVAQAADGVSWLATGSGLVPLTSRDNPIADPPPPVFLEKVLVNGQPVDFDSRSPLRLGPSESSVDFLFTAISFTVPEQVRFRHKLVNFDTDWVQNESARRAHYGPLPPGKYEFRVRAANAGGLWNETGASMALVVTPPLWRTWWFIALSASLAVLTTYLAARFISTRRLQLRLAAAELEHSMERERARIAQDMHDEIGSKLTRISFLSEIAREAGTETSTTARPIDAIANTSRELLQALDEIVWAVNPRNDSLEHLAGYLEQHAREYFQATAVEVSILVPAQIPPVRLSAETRHNVFLAFEEALNNALKHSEATRVDVTMHLNRGTFEICVRDNGKGFSTAPATPGQDGLQNMRERLRTAGGQCELANLPEGGASVTLRFPLPKPAAKNGETQVSI